MQTIINEALKNAEIEKEMKNGGAIDDDFVGQPRIVIIGCGGAGNNTVNRMHHMGVNGAETIAINTDKQHLDMIQADKRVLIGKSLTRGLGAGGYPDVGQTSGRDGASDTRSTPGISRSRLHHCRNGWRDWDRVGTGRCPDR